jgi:hypothetical protein
VCKIFVAPVRAGNVAAQFSEAEIAALTFQIVVNGWEGPRTIVDAARDTEHNNAVAEITPLSAAGARPRCLR